MARREEVAEVREGWGCLVGVEVLFNIETLRASLDADLLVVLKGLLLRDSMCNISLKAEWRGRVILKVLR